MERKIGEIFEFKKDWYQCVEGRCKDCHFSEKRFLCKQFITKDFCTHGIIFKKLEKVGEPFSCNYYGDARLVMMQEYQLFDENVTYCYSMPPMFVIDYKHKRIAIEIKVNKQDMEEKDIKPYDKIFSEGTVSNTENLVTSSLKPFDLEAAKAGKPVCTRDGHKARIICFDYNGETGDYPIVALVHYNKGSKCYERVLKYTSDGLFNKYGDCQHNDDLMMLPEKRSGWAKVRKDINLYDTKEEADRKMIGNNEYVTAKVCWEE